MNDADDLTNWLRSGRSAELDWLDAQTPVETLAAHLAAMANSRGGTLLLGIGAGETVSGVDDAADTLDRLLQAALSLDPPLIIPLPEKRSAGDKTVLVVRVPPGMPHIYAAGGRYLRRQEAANAPISSRELRLLIMQRAETSFETEVARGAGLGDIDWNKAKMYVAGLSGMGETSVEKVLLKRGCLVEHDGVLRPTHAGILLFGKDPQRHLRGADITAARFAGDTMSDRFSRQDILGTLPDQIRRAEMFLIDHLRKGVQLGQTMARDEQFEYPLEAARELVVNAVAHRDYQISGDGIRLFLFSNRMEVISPGALPGPVTIDNIKDERFSRNPVIVQVLSDMGFIERLGYGVDRVIDLMRQKQLRAPQFEERAGTFRVALYNEPVPTALETPPPAPAITFKGTYQGLEINPRQEIALVYLHENARITNSDLQNLCPDVHPETIRRDLADLVAKNILRKMGQKRGSYYVLQQTVAEET
ncbi:MAG: transcriptional regulator [Chloroflexi bacterium]|nr:transcriptional regulator [Chloroflexota bacterium]MDL1885368.1 transcriptional regulator [Anaerolineae bacterium CFX8]